MVSPEAVPLDLVPAGIGSRFLALALDWAVQAALALALLLALTPVLDEGTSGAGVALLLVLGTLVIFGYPVVLETLWRGRTIGKAALGLRVVTVEGGQVGLRHALIRGALGVIDFAATTGSAALIAALVTRRTQRLGDLAAGTLVLRERSALRAPAAVSFAPPRDLEAYSASLDVSALAPDDYLAVRSFLLRASALRPDARYRLAVALANPVSARLRPPPPPGTHPESFLVAVAAAYQARHTPTRPPSSPTAVAAAPGEPAPRPSSSPAPAPARAPAPAPAGDGADEGFAPPA